MSSQHYPHIIEAGKARNWAWLAHGKNNSTLQADVAGDAERGYLTDVVEHDREGDGPAATGMARPRADRDVSDPPTARRTGRGICIGLDERRPAVSG